MTIPSKVGHYCSEWGHVGGLGQSRTNGRMRSRAGRTDGRTPDSGKIFRMCVESRLSTAERAAVACRTVAATYGFGSSSLLAAGPIAVNASRAYERMELSGSVVALARTGIAAFALLPNFARANIA
jgi:hypothetical protein